jgi:signal transduction histidine kinase
VAALLSALWAWMGAVVLVGVLAWVHGGNANAVAGAVALALAPALAGFILAPRLDEGWAATGFIAAWLLASAGLVAGTGGATSPLAASVLMAPALVYALGCGKLAEASAGAVLAYVGGAIIAWQFGRTEPVGAFPELLSATSIVFAGGLLLLAPKLEADAPPAREEAVSRRLAEVSHELRTPLTHILGFAEIIEKELFGAIGQRNVEYAGLIRSSGTHLLHLVNDLLDLSKIDAGRYDLDLELFDARTVIDEVLRLSADAAERKQIVLSTDLHAAPLPVRADVTAFRRMLINTVSNAIKFTPESGRVTVEARANGPRLIIDTLDTGPGIPEAERDRLGAPYVRGSTGALAEGTGLGLSLVRALAQLHGGSLSFHDAPGGGALVRIEAPVMAD